MCRESFGSSLGSRGQQDSLVGLTASHDEKATMVHNLLVRATSFHLGLRTLLENLLGCSRFLHSSTIQMRRVGGLSMLEERTAIGFHNIFFELDVTALFPLCISQCKTHLFHPLGERILRHEVGVSWG